jgi:DMSO/TMAO reductase YedYZ molybdopterin-dependent catalytic subunit
MTVQRTPPLNPEGLVRRIPQKPHELLSRTTAQSDLFVLAHIGIPRLDISEWQLNVIGAVDNPLRFTFQDLCRLEKRRVECFHQCAGFPRRPDLPTRRIANVEWAGAAVRDVLCHAGVKSDARFLWAYGLDEGIYEDNRPEQYAKDLPLDRLDAGEWLLAYEINGEPLDPEHGYPVRLVVPGFYGTNSVKWVCQLEVARERYPGKFTQVLYNDPVPGTNVSRPVWEAGPECVIVSPADQATLAPGKVQIWGWTWGYRPIAEVHISYDGGGSWTKVVPENRCGWSWQRFENWWTAVDFGDYSLIARAIDIEGKMQPLQDARNAAHNIAVSIRC